MTATIIPFRAMNEKETGENRIREIRRAKRPKAWTQADLAEAIGTSEAQVSDLERGKLRLSVHWMEKIAGALGCSVADLLVDRHNPDRLSGDEKRLIEMHRQASEAERSQMMRVAEAVVGYRAPPRADEEPQRRSGT